MYCHFLGSYTLTRCLCEWQHLALVLFTNSGMPCTSMLSIGIAIMCTSRVKIGSGTWLSQNCNSWYDTNNNLLAIYTEIGNLCDSGWVVVCTKRNWYFGGFICSQSDYPICCDLHCQNLRMQCWVHFCLHNIHWNLCFLAGRCDLHHSIPEEEVQRFESSYQPGTSS